MPNEFPFTIPEDLYYRCVKQTDWLKTSFFKRSVDGYGDEPDFQGDHKGGRCEDKSKLAYYRRPEIDDLLAYNLRPIPQLFRRMSCLEGFTLIAERVVRLYVDDPDLIKAEDEYDGTDDYNCLSTFDYVPELLVIYKHGLRNIFDAQLVAFSYATRYFRITCTNRGEIISDDGEPWLFFQFMFHPRDPN